MTEAWPDKWLLYQGGRNSNRVVERWVVCTQSGISTSVKLIYNSNNIISLQELGHFGNAPEEILG